MRFLRSNPAFCRLWAAHLVSQTGTQISRIGLLLYLAAEWGSPIPIGALLVAETLPGLLAAPLGGVVADRFNKAAVMVAADLTRFGAMAAVLWQPTLSVILPAAALHAAATSFFQPAKSSVIPQIVTSGELVPANALDQAASNVVLIAGPALGAELLIRFGLAVTLVIDCGTFLLSALLIARLPTARQPAPAAVRPLADMISGWRYLRGQPAALTLCAVFFVGLLCAGLWTPLAPFFVRDYLDGSARTLGWQFGLFGAGAVAGTLLAPRAIAAFGRGPVLFGGCAAEGIAQTAYAAFGHPLLSTAMMLVWGIGVSFILVPFHAILQSIIDDRFLGRTFAAVRQAEAIATIGAMAIATVLVGWLDSRAILLAGGLLYCGVAILSWFTARGRLLLAL